MVNRSALPPELGDVFATSSARALGVGEGRLRNRELARPFHGVRCTPAPDDPAGDVFARVRADTLARVRAYAIRMRPGEFFVRETAVHLLGGPLPHAIGRASRPLDVGVFDNASFPRSVGVRGARIPRTAASLIRVDGMRLTSPASTWAALGAWSVPDLVALGDHLCRVWRAGVGRPHAGLAPLATPEQLGAAIAASRRVGAARLRAALELIRLDSWSPRETACRLHLVAAGLPEPELNIDIHDETGRFLGCVDLAYPRCKVAIEYQGIQHHDTYAADVERIERLRASGWTVIQVTSALLATPPAFVARVAAAIRPFQ